jgi:hypothetical protein
MLLMSRFNNRRLNAASVVWGFAMAFVPLTSAATDPCQAKLYSMFMSPCCWQQNLGVHQSPVAEQLRREIQVLVQNREETGGFRPEPPYGMQ